MVGQVRGHAFQSSQSGRDIGCGDGGSAGEDPTPVAMSGHDFAGHGDAPSAITTQDLAAVYCVKLGLLRESGRRGSDSEPSPAEFRVGGNISRASR